MSGIARSEPLKMADHSLTLGHAVHADLPNDARRKDLLCSSGAHAKEFLKLAAVNPRVGQLAQARDDLVELAAPGGPIRHFPFKKPTTSHGGFAQVRNMRLFWNLRSRSSQTPELGVR